MRIRTIKPEFWRSDDITSLSREDRLLFVGLWSYVDDNGVGIDDYRQIAADLFALEEDQKEVRDYVRDGLATLSRGFLVVRYKIEGRSLLFIPSWDKHQRIDKPSKVRYQRPPDDHKTPTSENVDSAGTLARVSRGSREGLVPGTGEQGNRGTGEEGQKTSSRSARRTDERFADFWSVYPRRVARKGAETAWLKAAKGADPDEIIEGAKRYAVSVRGKDPKFTKHPATWLNQGCWDDEPEPLHVVRSHWHDEIVQGPERRDPKTGRLVEGW